jgi:AcrR family transcriptional regulator
MQLTRTDWIEAGLELIERDGMSGLRVSVLARRLGVTKGSFYWHFKDRDDFLEAIVGTWEEDSRAFYAEAAKEPDPEQKIRALYSLLGERLKRKKGRFPDHSIFAWAHYERAIARRVATIERERLEFTSTALREMGFDRADAERVSLETYLMMTAWLEREDRCPELIPQFSVVSKSLMDRILSLRPTGETQKNR